MTHLKAMNQFRQVQAIMENNLANLTSCADSSCPSLSSSLHSADMSSQGASSYRRGSNACSEHSASQEDLSNLSTPITSFSSSDLVDIKASGIDSLYVANDASLPFPLYDYSMDVCSSSDPFWSTGDEFSSTPATMVTPPPGEHMARSGEESLNPALDFVPSSCPSANLHTSQPIFQEPKLPLDFADHPGLLGWRVAEGDTTPPQTVIPSAMFHTAFASPSYSTPPITPKRDGHAENSTSMAFSSPCVLSSPEADAGYPLVQSSKEPSFISPVRSRARAKEGVSMPSRLDKRPYTCQKRSSASSRVAKATTKRRINGHDNQLRIFEPNKHYCTIPGCIGKFKRKEHLKRHVQSVSHGNKGSKNDYFCVFCAKPLSRSDNLKQHKKQTHGQNKPNKRTKYVATCDKNSEWWDDEYEGLVGKDGLPTTDPKEDILDEKTKDQRATWMRLNPTNRICTRLSFKLSSRLRSI